MKGVKIQVIDSDLASGHYMCDVLRKSGYYVIGPSISYDQAIDALETEKPRIIIIDISCLEMRELRDVAGYIKLKENIPIVFIASNNHSNLEDYVRTLRPVACVHKPFNVNTLYSSIEIALNISQEESNLRPEGKVKDFFLYKHQGSYIKVRLIDILYIKSDSIYNYVFTNEKEGSRKHLIRSKITDFAKLFPEYFIQIHRSTTVNYRYIKSVTKDGVVINNQFLPMSPMYKKQLMDKFIRF